MDDLLMDVKVPSEPHLVLKVPLAGSGAIMIQLGDDLNKYYEHRVESRRVRDRSGWQIRFDI